MSNDAHVIDPVLTPIERYGGVLARARPGFARGASLNVEPDQACG